MRKLFKMTEEEMQEIIDINKRGGDPVMYISGGQPLGRSLQEKINDYWATLAEKYGFDINTVKPSSEGKLYFTAVSTEKK